MKEIGMPNMRKVGGRMEERLNRRKPIDERQDQIVCCWPNCILLAYYRRCWKPVLFNMYMDLYTSSRIHIDRKGYLLYLTPKQAARRLRYENLTLEGIQARALAAQDTFKAAQDVVEGAAGIEGFDTHAKGEGGGRCGGFWYNLLYDFPKTIGQDLSRSLYLTYR